MGKTKIEWSDMSWPVVTGCSHAGSLGCDKCYAARMAATRLKHHPRYEGLATFENGKARWTGEVRFNRDVLSQPLHWKKPRMIFVASTGDLFHEDVPPSFICEIWQVMRECPQHTFQILTKRAQRMFEIVTTYIADDTLGFEPLPNVWGLVTAEDQATADERIPWLLRTPFAVRGVSVEPMLGAIDLEHYLGIWTDDVVNLHQEIMFDRPMVPNLFTALAKPAGMARLYKKQLSWVIVGGESGHGARPMMLNWAQGIVNQCKAAGVPVFVKQVGTWAARAGKYKSRKGANPAEWPIYLRVREFPRTD